MLISFSCGNCQKALLRNPKVVAKNKSKKAFCSRSCSATYRLKHKKRRRSRGRSRAELHLVKLLKEVYTGEIKTNDRSVLPSKLELDVYLPELSLAIEVNGPTHYQPIYGEESLKATINRDKLKAAECKSLGITLIVLDISERHYSWRDARIHLESLYAAQVKSLVTG